LFAYRPEGFLKVHPINSSVNNLERSKMRAGITSAHAISIAALTLSVIALSITLVDYYSQPNISTSPTPPTFSVSLIPSSVETEAGGNTTVTVMVALESGTAQPVTLSFLPPPGSAISAVFHPEQGTPTFTSNMTVFVSEDLPEGDYGVVVMANCGNITKTVQLKVTVLPQAPAEGNVTTAEGAISVEGVDLVKTENATTFFIAIRNIGGKTVTDLTVTLASEPPVDVSLPNGELKPGQTISLELEELIEEYIAGGEYNAVIEATFSDGTVSSSTVTMICRSE